MHGKRIISFLRGGSSPADQGIVPAARSLGSELLSWRSKFGGMTVAEAKLERTGSREHTPKEAAGGIHAESK